MRNGLVNIAIFILLLGCRNPWTEFYRGQVASEIPGLPPAEYPLKVYGSDNFENDTATLLRRGYILLGEVAFQGPSNQQLDGPIRVQSAKVGASVVLVSSRYSHTVHGAVPLVIPTGSTTYTTGTAAAFGPGGTANAYGTGVSTTTGSTALMVPTSTDRSNFRALFFAKRGPYKLGIIARELTQVERQQIQSNAGVSIRILIDGSNAYAADFLEGDILRTLETDRIDGPEAFERLVEKYSGQDVLITGERNGKHFSKMVHIDK